MKRLALWGPLTLFALFAGLVAFGLLRPDDRQHKSQLIGKAFPVVAMPAAASSRPTIGAQSHGARLVNIFASWCGPCAGEAPVLALLQARGARIDGIAIRDRVPDIDRFLEANGNPFRAIGLDSESRVQIALGSSGVPETFIVDRRGIIRYQHIGPIAESDVPDLLRRLREAA